MTAGVDPGRRFALALLTAVLVDAACSSPSLTPRPDPADVIHVACAHCDYGKAFPHVSGLFGQRPHLAPGIGSPVRNPTSRAVIVGGGPTVSRGSAPVIRYLRAKWDGTVLHDSWAAGITADPIPNDPVGVWLGSMLQPWRVGSRVEVLVPDGGTAQVFVVDIMQAGTA